MARRDKVVQVRMDVVEHATVLEMARQAGIGVSSYMRMRALDGYAGEFIEFMRGLKKAQDWSTGEKAVMVGRAPKASSTGLVEFYADGFTITEAGLIESVGGEPRSGLTENATELPGGRPTTVRIRKDAPAEMPTPPIPKRDLVGVGTHGENRPKTDTSAERVQAPSGPIKSCKHGPRRDLCKYAECRERKP